MPYTAAPDRYDRLEYARVGRSGLKLPRISLGLWNNFGHDRPLTTQRDIVLRAFDLGVTHFDLANNYGPPPGSAEENFGRILASDLRPYRDELVISSKAGYYMWDGPYGDFGSRKYLLSSLDQSLARLGLDYVDIFYHHRPDPDTPIEESMGALAHAVRSGKALYVGISSYNSQRTREAASILREMGTPFIIHQPSYSMINRWVEEDGLLDTLDGLGVGSIVFSPLAQGLLTDKYLGDGTAQRAQQRSSLPEGRLSEHGLETLRSLAAIARERGQTLAQMAIQWVLRDPVVASALIGASRTEQLDENLAALEGPAFSDDELDRIDALAGGIDVDLWADSTRA